MIILFGVGEGNLWERPRELAGEARSRSCPRRFPPTSVGCPWCGFQSFKIESTYHVLTWRWHQKTKHVSQGAFSLVKENPPYWQSTKHPPTPTPVPGGLQQRDRSSQAVQMGGKHFLIALESRGVWLWLHTPGGLRVPGPHPWECEGLWVAVRIPLSTESEKGLPWKAILQVIWGEKHKAFFAAARFVWAEGNTCFTSGMLVLAHRRPDRHRHFPSIVSILIKNFLLLFTVI